jgi:hypothetical protein
MYWDFSGKLTSSLLNTNWHFQFKNRWNVNFNLTREMKNISNNMLRGGPSMHMPGGTEGNLNCFTDQTKKVWLYAGTYRGFGDLKNYYAYDYYGGIVAQPMNSLSVSIEPEFLDVNTKLQYVETANVGDDIRYLFAELDQKTLFFTFRLNFTINPELSLEYYGHPFISSGKYTNYKMITNPVADEFENRYALYPSNEITYNSDDNIYNVDENQDDAVDYSFDNPDFNFRQFRSNLVIRWEYLPGSTLFLVWSQGRTSSASDGNFSYGNDMKDLFTVQPHNVFLLKLSYWLPL